MLRVLATCSIVLLSNSTAFASPAAATLRDYVGTYRAEPDRPIEVGLSDDGLFAVQDEAKYRLEPSGESEFTDAAGVKFLFRHNSSGQMLELSVDGKPYVRQSSEITANSAALARPRRLGQDKPEDYHYRTPPQLSDGIMVRDITKSDLGPAVATAIVYGVLDGTYKDVDSVLLYQRGALVLEEYFYGYSQRRPHQLRSATKSIVSALAGIAVDEGAVPSVNSPVLRWMSYASYRNPEPRKSKMTFSDFLTMSSGLDCDDHSPTSLGRETVLDDEPDWVKATLDLPMINEPGSRGLYCSGGVAVVGRLVENAVHMYLPEYAQAKLCGPLGISPADWSWNYGLTNANKEYAQIHMRPRDMLKIGLLYFNGGRWQGHQVISSAWVRESLAEHSQVDSTGYGYFWWYPWLNVETGEGSQRVYFNAAQGNGGQKIYLVPQYQLVAVFTGGDYNSEGAPPNRIMSKIILPTLISAAGRGTQSTPLH